MTPEQADIVFELRSVPVEVYWQPRSRFPGWPETLVVMRAPDSYELAAITAALIRAIPDRHRGHVGVLATDRLRKIMLEGAERLALTGAEREAAALRSFDRGVDAILTSWQELLDDARAQAARLATEALVLDLEARRIAPLEVVQDPFRDPPPSVLLIGVSPALGKRIAGLFAVGRVAVAGAYAPSPYLRAVVCSEGTVEGVLSELATCGGAPPRLFVVCSEEDGDWLASYLQAQAPSARVLEEPVAAEELELLTACVLG